MDEHELGIAGFQPGGLGVDERFETKVIGGIFGRQSVVFFNLAFEMIRWGNFPLGRRRWRIDFPD